MSPQSFTTSPAAEGEQSKFINPTQGFVGANIFGPDGKPTSIAVEPGGAVWLTPAEQRMTAEAPQHPSNNPFVKEWEEVVEYDPTGEPARTVTRQGILVLSDEPPRPVSSARFIPGSADDLQATREAMEGLSEPADDVAELRAELAELRAQLAEKETKEAEETVKGADIPAGQPPVQGQPAPNEVIGTPDAPAKNARAVAARKATAEQPVSAAIPTED